MLITQDGGVPIKSWTDGVLFEEEARHQVLNLSRMPFIHRHVAVMPNVHAGIGATVGSVIATSGAIIPAAVGVDIGCGVVAQRLNLTASDLPDNLHGIRLAIEDVVPVGRTDNGGRNDVGAWQDEPPEGVDAAWASLAVRFHDICEKHPKVNHTRALGHLGTLGTGNHFIEVCLDEKDSVWVMLHSGSRGVGNRIGTYFIEKAKAEMRRWFINLPDADLAYLPEGSELFLDYMEAVGWAQDYALMNRALMLEATIRAMSFELGRPLLGADVAVQCHHNYVAHERHFGKNVLVTRKGALSAQEGELSVIPGSMGTHSYVVRGKGNRESFCSCSHGAGRRMSRTEARKRFTVEEHVEATLGVECRKDASVLDETPAAYKDIDKVMAAQADLVEVVAELHQVVCVKG